MCFKMEFITVMEISAAVTQAFSVRNHSNIIYYIFCDIINAFIVIIDNFSAYLLNKSINVF